VSARRCPSQSWPSRNISASSTSHQAPCFDSPQPPNQHTPLSLVCEEVCLTLPMPHCALRIRVARVQHGEFCDSARARRRAGCRQGTRRGLGSSPLRHASPRGSRLLCHCSTSGCLWRCYGGGGARAPSHWRCDGECLVFSSCTNTERLTPESAPHRRPRASLSRTAWACCWRSSYTPQST